MPAPSEPPPLVAGGHAEALPPTAPEAMAAPTGTWSSGHRPQRRSQQMKMPGRADPLSPATADRAEEAAAAGLWAESCPWGWASPGCAGAGDPRRPEDELLP